MYVYILIAPGDTTYVDTPYEPFAQYLHGGSCGNQSYWCS